MIKKIFDILKFKIRGETSTFLLKQRGLIVGDNFRRNEHCIIDDSHCWLIEIGNNVTLAPNVHILAHDASMWNETGYTKIAPVYIGDNVFIGAGSIILPGVHIGENSIVGAGSVVTKDVAPGSVVAGNPAVLIKSYDSFIDYHKSQVELKKCYDESYTLRNKKITRHQKEEMKENLEKSGFAYVE